MLPTATALVAVIKVHNMFCSYPVVSVFCPRIRARYDVVPLKISLPCFQFEIVNIWTRNQVLDIPSIYSSQTDVYTNAAFPTLHICLNTTL